MPEINDEDAIRMAIDYYEKKKGFAFIDAVKIVAILSKAGIVGLIQSTFDQAVSDTIEENRG